MEAQNKCENCVHFHQHYTKKIERCSEIFTKIYQGHCVNPRLRLRNRSTEAPACEQFEPQEDEKQQP